AGVKGWIYTGQLISAMARPTPQPGTVESGGLWPYLGNQRVYWCPLDLQRTNSSAKPRGSSQSYRLLFNARANKLGSFICNGAVSGFGTLPGNGRPNTYKVDRFFSTNYLLWGPDEMNSFWFNECSRYPIAVFSTQLTNGAN